MTLRQADSRSSSLSTSKDTSHGWNATCGTRARGEVDDEKGAPRRRWWSQKGGAVTASFSHSLGCPYAMTDDKVFALRICIWVQQALESLVRALPDDIEALVVECGWAVLDVVLNALSLSKSLARLGRLLILPLARWAARLVLGQPWLWLAIEGGVLMCVAATLRLRRWWRRSPTVRQWVRRVRSARAAVELRWRRCREEYARLLANVAHKSRLAAAALPHAAFCIMVAASLRFSQKTSRAVYCSPHLAATLLLARMRSTHRAKIELQEARWLTLPAGTSGDSTAIIASPHELEMEALVSAIDQAKFWVCACFERALRAALYALPYGVRISKNLDVPLALTRGLLLLWLSLFAADGAYAVAARAAQSMLPSIVGKQRKHASSLPEKWRRAVGGFLGRIGSIIPLLVGSKATKLAALVSDIVTDADAWLLLLIGGAGLCTIGPVARLAAVAVIFVLPALAAIKAVARREPKPSQLGYFLVLQTIDLALLNPNLNRIALWLPFKAHLSILLALWLQLPYFHGADKLHNIATLQCRHFLDKFKEA